LRSAGLSRMGPERCGVVMMAGKNEAEVKR
jgi:hypothetical protein